MSRSSLVARAFFSSSLSSRLSPRALLSSQRSGAPSHSSPPATRVIFSPSIECSSKTVLPSLSVETPLVASVLMSLEASGSSRLGALVSVVALDSLTCAAPSEAPARTTFRGSGVLVGSRAARGVELLSFVIDMPETYASLGPPGAQGFRGALCTAVHNRLCTSVVLDHLARGPGESGGSPEPELSAATWAA